MIQSKLCVYNHHLYFKVKKMKGVEGMEKANLTAEIDKNVFQQISLFAVQNDMKKKDVVELALIEFLEKHFKGVKY